MGVSLKRVRMGWLVGALLWIANGSNAGEPTMQPLPRLETGMHTAAIRSIATDAAGRWAVTASDDKTARVWEVASGKQLRVLRPPQDVGDEGKLYAVAMSPDGSTAALGGWTGRDWDRVNWIYLFERSSGHLLRRIPGLPSNVTHLAYSPDGRWLAASLDGANGVRLFDAAQGRETGRDADYGDGSYSVHFSPDSLHLVTTSLDGGLRTYAVDRGRLGTPQRVALAGGKRPVSARYSPNGRRIAVGFDDTTMCAVLDAVSFAEVARPNTKGVTNGSLISVAWSADSRFLVAGGTWDDGKYAVRRWPVGDWSRYSDTPLADGTIQNLTPLPGGSVLFAAADATWGVIDSQGAVRLRQGAAITNLSSPGRLRAAADARQVRFGNLYSDLPPRSFDVVSRSLGADRPELPAPRTSAPGLAIESWGDNAVPTLNGRPIVMKVGDFSLSLAIAPDAQRFVLGAVWSLRQVALDGADLWTKPVPGPVWAVTISADARFVVAAYGDGTIRWHRYADGTEVLALFPHADRRRWIAWTPEGFYAASGDDAEDLLGYHLNQGKDREGQLISARQLRERFHQPGLISSRLDADGDRLMADAVAKLGDVRQLLAAGRESLPPTVELVSAVAGDDEVTITVKVKDQGGGVGEVVFYVDGTPQSGRRAGVVDDATSSRSFALPPGSYRFEAMAKNRAGTDSNRVDATAKITGRAPDAALHILAIGVQDYRDTRLALQHSAADARAVAQEIATRARPLFGRGVFTPKVLIDAEATLAGIEQAFNEIKQRIKPQDTLVIFLAGHGEAPVGKNYTFLPWDFQRGAPGRQGAGFDETSIRKMLQDSPTQTLLLLDTCDAGGAAAMLRASYERLNGFSKQVVIGASRQGEFAKEGFEGHGVFTAALLRVMRAKPDDDTDRRLNVLQLRAAVANEVDRIGRGMPSGSGQKVSGYLGSADFPLVMR